MLSAIPVLAAVFIFGTCVGSFLNVCIHRIPKGQSIVFPGSSCPFCSYAIPWYLNIPIFSFLFLKGRCRKCDAPISARYPAVEILTGFFAAALVLKFGLTLTAIFWFVFIAVLIVISFIDMDLQIIPDSLSLPGIVVFASSFVFLPGMTLKDTLLGIGIGGGSLYAVALGYYLIRKEEGMGGGDIKLLAMIGAATGWKGVLFTIMTGSFLGTVAGIIIMIATRITDIKLRIPFGPYLSAGAILYIFYGNQIIRWYLGFIQ